LQFLEYEVVVRDLGQLKIDEIKEVFQRINSTSYSLNAMEIHNAPYDGEYKALAEELSSNRLFDEHRFFSANEIRRMADVRFALVLMTTMLSGYFNRDDPLEEYLQRYNDQFPEKDLLRANFEKTSNFIERCEFPDGSRIWKKADFFSAYIELHDIICKKRKRIAPRAIFDALGALYCEVEAADANEVVTDESNVLREKPDSRTEAAQYARAALQASNDRSSRITRGQIVRKRLEAAVTQGQLL
jgi:hypothetical protein